MTPTSSLFRFKHHVIDTDLPDRFYAQTALADMDGDGRLEYVMGRADGELYIYKYHAPDRWTRHLVGTNSPGAVELAVMDVDGDGKLDLVVGGVWYRNSGSLDKPFERLVYDAAFGQMHDIISADINGDGKLEIVAMSDMHDLRWYRIPSDPAQPWTHTRIAPGVHAGAAVGDLNGDGKLDVVRTDVWYENVKGDGSEWVIHPIGPCTPPPADFHPWFTFNATRAWICDMDQDGVQDIVFTDAEIPGGKIWWMENVNGDGLTWIRHEVPNGDSVRRGAYHTLHVGDFDGDGDLDIFACEMEEVSGKGSPRWFIWENVDGKGQQWKEHVILDVNLGGHEAVVGDITGRGRLDIIGKPWFPDCRNALGGKMFVVFLENLGSENPA